MSDEKKTKTAQAKTSQGKAEDRNVLMEILPGKTAKDPLGYSVRGMTHYPTSRVKVTESEAILIEQHGRGRRVGVAS